MQETSAKTLLLIAAFKLFKASILLVVALGAVRLIHRDIADTLTGWAEHLHVDPGNRHIHRVFEKVFQTTPKQLTEVAAGTFFYSGLLAIEGVGLFMRRRWAEYFTVITTAVFLPLEIFEMVEKLTATRVLILIVNCGIVWYLVNRLRNQKAFTEGHRSSA